MGGLFGLFGSGEFLPWAVDVDRRLVAAGAAAGRNPGRVLVVPTASAPEGDKVFYRWGAMGREHYRSAGFEPEVVELKDRADAARHDIAAQVAGASLIFFSGGNPAYLARTLAGTPFWSAVAAAVGAGTSLAGSSAGASFLGAVTLDSAAVARGGPPSEYWVPGVRWLQAIIGPHWDAMERWRPGAKAEMEARVPEGCALLGVDENTAVVGDGTSWEVMGRATATVKPWGGETSILGAGERFELALQAEQPA